MNSEVEAAIKKVEAHTRLNELFVIKRNASVCPLCGTSPTLHFSSKFNSFLYCAVCDNSFTTIGNKKTEIVPRCNACGIETGYEDYDFDRLCSTCEEKYKQGEEENWQRYLCGEIGCM